MKKSPYGIYNSNMCLYFLNKYTAFNKIPNQMIDVNIASDYSKLAKMIGCMLKIFCDFKEIIDKSNY